MSAICLSFAIHEPYALRRYTIFDVDGSSTYEDDDRTCSRVMQLAQESYLPMNELLYRQIQKYKGAFRISLSVSHTAMDLFEQYTPEVLISLKKLAETGCVEFVTETGPHSLAYFFSRDEFISQIERHSKLLEKTFGKKPTTFRHSELLYTNTLGDIISELGYKTVLTEGARRYLGWRNANYVYSSATCKDLHLLLRNSRLSNDLSLRFANKNWDQWPLTADKFADWCSTIGKEADCINLFTDFHLFGVRHPKETGIFEFMEALPKAVLAKKNLCFQTPAQVVDTYPVRDSLDIPKLISWNDEGADISGWLNNEMQKDAITQLYTLGSRVLNLKDEELLHTYERLQTSDYFHYMSTRWFSESRPDRPSPFLSPYDAYISVMNILTDFTHRVEKAEAEQKKAAQEPKKEAKAAEPTHEETQGTKSTTANEKTTEEASQEEQTSAEPPHTQWKTSTKGKRSKKTS